MISSLPWSLDFLFSAPFWITSHNSFLLQPPFTISAPTIILWHSYSLPSLVSLLPTPPPHFCSKLLIGVFLHSHHPLLWNIVSPQQYIFHMYALLECFPQYDIVIFLLSDSNGILVFYLWQLKLTFYTYQDLLFVNSHKNTYYFQSESTTQVALERENKRFLVFGVSILIARKQLAAECNQQLVKRGVYGLMQGKLLRLFHPPFFPFLFTKM